MRFASGFGLAIILLVLALLALVPSRPSARQEVVAPPRGPGPDAPALKVAQAEVDPPGEPAEGEDEDDSFRPGLVAVYRSLTTGDPGATLSRVDAKPAFMLGDSSPHPRIAPGPFEAVWTGTLELFSADALRFGAYVGGTVTIAIDGETVLEGRGDSEASWVQSHDLRDWPRGARRFRVVYRSLPGVPARLQIWWEGGSFSREPLPAWRLKHGADEVTEAVKSDDLAAHGRSAMGKMGCAQCHRTAFPAVDDPPPGPSLAGLGGRADRSWLLRWLEDPAKVRHGARMPALFAPDRGGLAERWIVADYLLKVTEGEGANSKAPPPAKSLDGRTAFLGFGCFACHPVPDRDEESHEPRGRYPLAGLRGRFMQGSLSAFLEDPHSRYPDGRMPRLSVTREAARDIAAYLLEASPPDSSDPGLADAGPPVSPAELDTVARRLDVSGLEAAGPALVREKRCLQCHEGLGKRTPEDIPIRASARSGEAARGCLSGRTLPRFAPDAETRLALAAYLPVAAREMHSSPFEARQKLLGRYGCFQCHQRDSDLPAPIEEVGGRILDHKLTRLPGQRTPRLTNLFSKYLRSYVRSAVGDGVSGVRPKWYSYRMPAFGDEADRILRALAEFDGDLVEGTDPPSVRTADPELPAAGPRLVGSAGYSCVACHVWNGKNLTEPEPGAAGPELMTVTSRIRRDFFDRWVDEPSRVHPRTPMPQIFRKGQPAMLATVLDGDARRQKDALWAYFALGKGAPSPVSLPPTPVPAPLEGRPALVAQVPLHLPDLSVVEALCVLYGSHDLLLYDIGRASLRDLYAGAWILRVPKDRRSFALAGERVGTGLDGGEGSTFELVGPSVREAPSEARFLGYDRLRDGARVRTRLRFASGPVDVSETFRIPEGSPRRLLREFHVTGMPASFALEVKMRLFEAGGARVEAAVGEAEGTTLGDQFIGRFSAEAATREARGNIQYEIPPPRPPGKLGGVPPAVAAPRTEPGVIDGETARPGYRAIAYPRPKTAFGEDSVMPGAIVSSPRDGRVFVASMKMGELFALDDPLDNGEGARFVDFGGGLFQDAYWMVHDGEALYLLHRRNLTRIVDADGDGVADTFDRELALRHGVTENVDNAYGLVRDRSGAFVFTYAANTSRRLPGWGSILRAMPGEDSGAEELGFGMRRAFGWSLGPEGEVFFTDNQGEWVASNKLCQVIEGRYYGYPNPGQEQHLSKPTAKPAVWVPYSWATSTNGLVYDSTGGKFGPFAGQFFMAGWTDRGGVVRAQVEKINGVYQGACFPFWGKGMLGPLCLAFDPKGRLYVGGITEGTCGADPDRGALFRIDYTGAVPFEIRSIHALPRGFRLVFTKPLDPRTAREAASYALEHYRYEYSGDYGSPELDRTRVALRDVAVHADGLAVDLTPAAPLVKDRVYLIHARGARSSERESLVHPTGAYTLNEIPTHDVPWKGAGR